MFSRVEGELGTSLFADDGAIWKRSKNIQYAFRQMQTALDRISDWANEWGFMISTDKTKCIIQALRKRSRLWNYQRMGAEMTTFI